VHPALVHEGKAPDTAREMQEYKARQEKLDQAMPDMITQSVKIKKKDSTKNGGQKLRRNK
jgi:hypothetical protein